MKKILLTAFVNIVLVSALFGQSIQGITNLWFNTYGTNFGGFGRAIIDNDSLVISGTTWPSWPNGTTDQMITKVHPNGGEVWRIIRSPGGDHDGYSAVCLLNNGNYAFFGQQNAQGTQYFDAFFTIFNRQGVELSYNFFSIPGSTSGTDMKKLPNGNLVFTGIHTGGQNFVALTNQNFNQINYTTFNVGGWNAGQLVLDTINSIIYAIGSEPNTSTVKITKYDYALNLLGNYSINNAGPTLIYDADLINGLLAICGYTQIAGIRYGRIYKINSNGTVADSYLSSSSSEFTAITTVGDELVVAKSNLNGTLATSNELNVYIGNGLFGPSQLLNNGIPFVAYDLVKQGNNIYAIGAKGNTHWIGIPAIAKLSICRLNILTQPISQTSCNGNNTSFTISANGSGINYQWQVSSDGGSSFINVQNTGVYSGATAAMLNITGTTISQNNYKYRCQVTSATCSVPILTNIATLTVRQKPTIGLSASPLSILLPGQSTTLTATPSSSTGSTVSYKWFKDVTEFINSSNTFVADISKLGAYQVKIQESWADGTTCFNESNIVIIAAKSSPKLFIFPSPNDGRFKVAYYNSDGNSSTRTVSVFDTKGARVYNATFPIMGPYTLLNIDLTPASSGIYMVVVGDNKGNKLVVGKVMVRWN